MTDFTNNLKATILNNFDGSSITDVRFHVEDYSEDGYFLIVAVDVKFLGDTSFSNFWNANHDVKYITPMMDKSGLDWDLDIDITTVTGIRVWVD